MTESAGRSRFSPPSWPVALAVALGLAATVVAFVSVRTAGQARLDAHFDRVSAHLETVARQRLNEEFAVLYSVRDAFLMSDHVTRQDFQTFALGQLARHPDVQALEWVPEVRHHERRAYEEAARKDGFKGFHLTERDAQGRLVPAGPREVYYPVYYVEPLAGNEPALGYAPVLKPRDEAIALARDTGRPAASQAFPIVQSNKGQVGVAVFVPVYERGPEPSSVAERRARLVGLVEGVLLPERMMGPLVTQARALGVATTLIDESAPPGERALITPPTPPDPAARQHGVPLDMGARQWKLTFAIADARALGGSRGTEWLVLLAGLAGTGLLGGFLQRTVERRARAEQLVEERTRALQQAQAIERMKNNFVDAVTHDLRTPLTSIKGYTELLADEIGGPLTDEQHLYVRQIERGTTRLAGLVDDLLDFARLDAGTFRLRCQPCDLVAEIREVADGLRLQVEEAGIRLEVPPETEVLEAPMDPARIERVLFNLVHNAIKFSPNGGTIWVRASRGPDHLRCEVEDMGQGIPQEELPRLFKRFSQLEEGSAKGGTGLGLSIAKAIVEAHGGQIGVDSTLGQGSTFWFTLPAGPAFEDGGEGESHPGEARV